jgi:hypothetical protein
MRTHYTCGKCKVLLEATTDYFHPCSLKTVAKNNNLLAISRCKSCTKQYAIQWRSAIKAKGLVRSQKTTLVLAGAVTGTIYVIGPDISGTPYKIGITSGSNTHKRKMSLQTAHWMDLKLVWKSDLLNRADLIEKKLHKHFEKQRVRGEWFNISQDDIKNIPKLIKHFGVEL